MNPRGVILKIAAVGLFLLVVAKLGESTHRARYIICNNVLYLCVLCRA